MLRRSVFSSLLDSLLQAEPELMGDLLCCREIKLALLLPVRDRVRHISIICHAR